MRGVGERWWIGCSASALAACSLALAGCDDEDAQSTWVARQTCSLGIAPRSSTQDLPPVLLPLATEFTYTADGVLFRDFTLGPLGSFACSAPLVNATYTTEAPFPRELALEPFDCIAEDGRIYELGGTGIAELDSMFVDMTFSAWFGDDTGVVLCTSTWRRQGTGTPDAGAPLGPADTIPRFDLFVTDAGR